MAVDDFCCVNSEQLRTATGGLKLCFPSSLSSMRTQFNVAPHHCRYITRRRMLVESIYGTMIMVIVTEFLGWIHSSCFSYNSDIEYQYASNWPSLNRTLGSVSAVSFDPCGNVVIFHRGSHVWNERSFNEENRYLPIIDGPITESTVLQLNNASGVLICEWGSN